MTHSQAIKKLQPLIKKAETGEQWAEICLIYEKLIA